MAAATTGATYQVGETIWGALVIPAHLFAECVGENFGAVNSAEGDNPPGVHWGTIGTQYSFRKGHSAVDAITRVMDNGKIALDKK